MRTDKRRKSDQSILQCVSENFPEKVGLIADEWSVHIGHGYRASPQKLIQKQKAGFLHFTGINTGNFYWSDKGLIKFCIRGRRCNHEETAKDGDVESFQRSW
eukprot:7521138-Ditylum_brightwellii.AAC.1